MKKDKIVFWVMVIVTVFIIAGIVYAIIRSGKVKEKTKIISDAIDSKVGALGTDIDSLLANVKADTTYRVLDTDLVKLYSAKGPIYKTDSPEYIGQVLTGKTKAQIKSIIGAFLGKYQIKFNDHLNNIFDDTFGYDSKGYENVLNIVRNAR